ncbi:MAG: hypothetical protein VKJ02_17925 [Snowella sp.]|nr:hypothetical protein [Snowella sp.]
MNNQQVENPAVPLSEFEFETFMKERRSAERILAFCQILDLSGEFIGVSFDLTATGICLSLPHTWMQEDTFSVILKRGDAPDLPQVQVTVDPVWHNSRNEHYDEIGGKIIAVGSEADFQTFLHYCQTAGPSGLFTDSE